MTFIVKCDVCGKTQEPMYNPIGDPINPFNKDTGERWYSRLTDDGKTAHACCYEHIPKGEIALPL